MLKKTTNIAAYLKLRQSFKAIHIFWRTVSKSVLWHNIVNHCMFGLNLSNGLQVALCERLAGNWGGTKPVSRIIAPFWRWVLQSKNAFSGFFRSCTCPPAQCEEFSTYWLCGEYTDIYEPHRDSESTRLTWNHQLVRPENKNATRTERAWVEQQLTIM